MYEIRYVSSNLDMKKILNHEEELEYLNLNEEKKKEFLTSRYVIKSNICKKFNVCDFQSITVSHNVLGSPFVKGVPNIDIAISHSKGMVFIACYDKKNIIGIDIQHIDLKLDIQSFLKYEKRMYKFDTKATFMAISVKESLGKALKIGLMGSSEIYNISCMKIVNFKSQKLYKFLFEKFKFFKGYGLEVGENYVLTFVTSYLGVDDLSMIKDIEECIKNIMI